MSKRPILFTVIGTIINILGAISPKLGARCALYLFQSPRGKKLKESEIQYLESARFNVPNGQPMISYYKWGEHNRSLLLNHGWESSAIRWKPYIGKLNDLGYSVIAIDAPSHGLSKHNKFNAYLYSLALYPLIQHCQPEIVIGHSIGGFVSVLTGAEQPQYQPNRYILLAPNNKIKDTFATYQSLLGMTDRVMSVAIEMVKDMTPEGHAVEYFESEKLIKSIPVPIDIIHDKQDRLLPFSESKRLEEMYDNVTLHETDGYGHRLRSLDIVTQVVSLVENHSA